MNVRIASETRMKSLNEMQTLCDETGHETSLEEYMIRSAKVRWSIKREDLECWSFWDEKEEFMDGPGSSRARQTDKIKSLALKMFIQP